MLAAGFREHASRHVHTEATTGLTLDGAARAIELLGGRASAAPPLPPPPSESELCELMLSPSPPAAATAGAGAYDEPGAPTPSEIREERLFAASLEHTMLGGGAFSFYSSPVRRSAR